MEVHLRQLRTDDAPRLVAFYNGLSTRSRRLFRPLGWTADLQQCQDVVEAACAGDRFDVVAVEDDRIVGWAFLTRMREPTPHLGIACAEDHHGQGLGTRLMQTVMEHARAHDKQAVDLIVVQENDRARRLYEKHGFHVTGTHTGDDGLDYFRMVARL